MSNLLQTLNQASDKWSRSNQPSMMEATISSLGNSSATYTIQFKNGARASNVSGPTGLSAGNAVVVASYPGKTKKFAILQQASGGSVSSSITTVQV